MSMTVCLAGNALSYLEGGGHLWVYLNWALGLRACGCEVIWLEHAPARMSDASVRSRVATLKEHLRPYGFADCIALCSWSAEPLSPELTEGCVDFETAAAADVLLTMQYGTKPRIVERFRRSALIDIDPGLLQTWMSTGQMEVAPHDAYFTISEIVGSPEAQFPDGGVVWQHSAPCAALEWWPECPASEDSPFTTVAHWSGGWNEYQGEVFADDKRSAFEPYLDLPRATNQRLELALCLGEDESGERERLETHGWAISHSYDVSSTPWEYQRYVQRSRGEFSCARPSYVRMQTTWISDRTVCYLASGKPAVVQHTGPSRFLPDAAGLFRFHDLSEAKRYLTVVANDYDHQCKLARQLAERNFDARTVVGSVLERVVA